MYEASIRKQEKIEKKLKAAEIAATAAAKEREMKKKSALKVKEKQKLAIIQKNAAKQAKGLEGAEQVEIQKKLVEVEKKNF